MVANNVTKSKKFGNAPKLTYSVKKAHLHLGTIYKADWSIMPLLVKLMSVHTRVTLVKGSKRHCSKNCQKISLVSASLICGVAFQRM